MKPLFALLLCLGVVTSSAAFAAMTSQQRTDFTASCQRQMYMSKGECVCMADIADKTLDEAAITYTQYCKKTERVKQPDGSTIEAITTDTDPDATCLPQLLKKRNDAETAKNTAARSSAPPECAVGSA